MQTADEGNNSLRRKTSKLVRQGSVIETNTDSSGVVQMTYWF